MGLMTRDSTRMARVIGAPARLQTAKPPCKRRGGKICLVIALVCASGAAAAGERDYCAEVMAAFPWEMPQDIKSLPVSKQGPASNAFVLEGLRGLTAADLITAARQCCEVERKRGGYISPGQPLESGKSAAVICLEWYPQKLEGADGIQPLLSIIADRRDNVCLRSFLLSALGTRITTFSKYLNDYADAHREATLKQLRAIADDVDDSEVVRAEAEGAYLRLRPKTPNTGGGESQK